MIQKQAKLINNSLRIFLREYITKKESVETKQNEFQGYGFPLPMLPTYEFKFSNFASFFTRTHHLLIQRSLHHSTEALQIKQKQDLFQIVTLE